MRTEKNNKRTFKEKFTGKPWTGKSETKKYADKKKPEFKKNVTKKTDQKKPEGKKNEGKKEERKRKSLCPVHGRCGGCQLLDIPYKDQLKQKQTQVTKLLKPYCPVAVFLLHKKLKKQNRKYVCCKSRMWMLQCTATR